MAYIGTKPTIGNFQICDAISVVNGQAAYTMQIGSVNVIPQSANHMIVSLNGTIQKPNSSYTVSGSTITFASNLATGDVIDFIQILGDVLDLGVPSDATVTTAKLADSSVSLAKLTASGTKDATTFLRGDNTFATVSSDYVNLTYDFIISTYYVEQLNKIVEAINYASDSYWGNPERYQFRARIDNFATPVEIENKGERAVKATFSLKLYGYLVPDIVQKQLNSLKKFNTPSQIVFNMEVVQNVDDLNNQSQIENPLLSIQTDNDFTKFQDPD